MSLIVLGILMLYIFYKLIELDEGSKKDEDFEDFIMMRDAISVARGDNPHDPKAQWKSTIDPLNLHDKK